MIQQYALPLPHSEAFGVEDYSVTDSNREAFAWVDAWPNWPAPCLILYGPEGSGKTHLAGLWQKKVTARVYPAPTLDENAWKNIPPHGACVLIDDAEPIAGHAEREEALFHLYNVLKETKGHILLTAQQEPNLWPLTLPDLRSRLCAAPAVGIQEPDDALLLSLLLKQFRDRQIAIGQDVAAYILPRIERTPAAIRSLVAELDLLSLAEHKGVSIALAKRVLEKTISPSFLPPS